MTHVHKSSPPFGALAALALAACAESGEPADPAARGPDLEAHAAAALVEVEARVIARDEALTYDAFATRHAATGAESVAVPPLRARFATHGDRTRLTVELDGKTTAVDLDPGGKVAADVAEAPTGGDLYDTLPPAGARLALGVPYTSGGPPLPFVQANAAGGSLTLEEVVTSTPIGSWTVDHATVVRVETRAMNRLYWIAADGSLAGQDLGLSYLGVADLLAVPGAGWRVLRLMRLSEGDTGKLAADVTLADLRRVPHSEFVACAASSSLVADPLRRAARLASTAVPEFHHCTGR